MSVRCSSLSISIPLFLLLLLLYPCSSPLTHAHSLAALPGRLRSAATNKAEENIRTTDTDNSEAATHNLASSSPKQEEGKKRKRQEKIQIQITCGSSLLWIPLQPFTLSLPLPLLLLLCSTPAAATANHGDRPFGCHRTNNKKYY
jgi:hypothetical protein